MLGKWSTTGPPPLSLRLFCCRALFFSGFHAKVTKTHLIRGSEHFLKDYAYDLKTQRSALHTAFFSWYQGLWRTRAGFFTLGRFYQCVSGHCPHESLHQGSIFFKTCVCEHMCVHACAWWHCFWCSCWNLGYHSLKCMVAYCTLPWPITR